MLTAPRQGSPKRRAQCDDIRHVGLRLALRSRGKLIPTLKRLAAHILLTLRLLCSRKENESISIHWLWLFIRQVQCLSADVSGKNRTDYTPATLRVTAGQFVIPSRKEQLQKRWLGRPASKGAARSAWRREPLGARLGVAWPKAVHRLLAHRIRPMAEWEGG